MHQDPRGRNICVGIKQSTEAVADGRAERVYIAEDADEDVVRPIKTLCADKGVELVYIETKKQLGRACGISVAAACAAALK